MSPELSALAALVALQIVFGLTVTAVVSARTGVGYVLGSRAETDVDLSTGLVGRLHRARLNAFEALVYFTPTVAVVELGGLNSPTTAAAAWTFVAARVAYLACYALDLVPWRSVVWLIGIAAIATMLGSAVP